MFDENKMRYLALLRKYSSPAKASGYRQELAHSVAHPEEEELKPADILKINEKLAEINEFLELAEER